MSETAAPSRGAAPDGARRSVLMRSAGDSRDPVSALRWWAALPAAALGGLLLDVATPGIAFWPAVFPGVALVLAAVWQQRAVFALLAGVVAGATFWLPHLSWLTLYLGPVPWLGLSGLMIVWFALCGLATALATRGLARRLAGRPALLRLLQVLAAAGLWVGREQLQGSWPYGGFPWGRLAHALSDSPLSALVSWIGFAGLSGLVAALAALPVAAALAPRGRQRRARGLAAGATAGAAVLTIVLLALVPPAQLEQRGSLRVAAVQGNAKAGIFDDRESGDVLRAHLDATTALLDRLEADGETVDLIVWPENSAEFELRDNPLGKLRIAQLAQRADAPIVLGSILADDGVYTNSSLVWGPRGDEGARYDKIYPVPFAEYMPNRDFFHALAPDLVDLVQLEYTAGRLSPVIGVSAGGEEVRAGVAICFDIIFDRQAVDMQRDGAELILAQTNNADFGRTDESVQQLAIARLRAVETGRALVNVSTVGTSAIVAPDGRDLDRLVPFTADAMVAEVPLMRGETPAMRFGALVAAAWIAAGIAAGIAGLGAGAWMGRRHRTP